MFIEKIKMENKTLILVGVGLIAALVAVGVVSAKKHEEPPPEPGEISATIESFNLIK